MSERKNAWQDAILPIDSTILQAINNLNESAQKIVMVIDNHGTFLGTISDGDIRRALLKGYHLDDVISDIVNRSSLSASYDMDRNAIRQLMLINKLQQIPIIDSQLRPIGLHSWDSIFKQEPRNNLMVIMAGGMGMRMRPLTEECPKPMINISGKPMLEHIINYAKEDGFVNFALITYYLGHMIEDYFGDGGQFNINITYFAEDSPLGTAGGISLLNPKPELPFVVTNGDVLSNIRYGAMLDYHIRHNASGTMAVRFHEWQNPFGVVKTNDMEIIGFEEKPVIRSQINAGVYVLNPESTNYLEMHKHCHMPELFERIKMNGKRVIAYPVHETWMDVGRIEDLEKARSLNYID